MANLRDLLKKFYIETRRKDKEEYSKSTLTTLRFGLCRYIKSKRPELTSLMAVTLMKLIMFTRPKW